MYNGVKVRYCKRENGKNKYFTKILKFVNGIPETAKGVEFDFNYKNLEKWIFSQLPERIKFLGYELLTA